MEENKSFRHFYDKNYKKLLLIPFILLVLAFAQIGYQQATTGDFLNKGVSLKGGVTVSVESVVDVRSLEVELSAQFPESDLVVRELSSAGNQIGAVIEASEIDGDLLVSTLVSKLNLENNQYSVETLGSSLGDSFFRETFRIIILAFLFMGLVVFLYFGEDWRSKAIAAILTLFAMPVVYSSNSIITKTLAFAIVGVLIYVYLKYSIPSFAVILAAFSDIVITLAIINLLGVRISSAGIAAFLMLIGYSVDTDILLSTKVLKTRQGSVTDAIWGAMKTGMMMTVTTLVAIIIAYTFAQSDVLKQIMLILIIGLVVDFISTWVQNAGILKWHIERKRNG